MTARLSEFDQVQKLNKPRKVKLGDDWIVYAYGIGILLLDTSKSILKLENVPDLACNLISVGKAVRSGCRVIFDEPDYCEIVDNPVVGF